MQQYRIEFFDRTLTYVYHDFSSDLSIDDDYIAIQSSVIEIGPTKDVEMGQFIRIIRDETDYFFGIVTDASPGECVTTVTFKPFMALFDEDILFDTSLQTDKTVSTSLENVLKKYIRETYAVNSDSNQNLPLTVNVPALDSYHTKNWSFNIRSDTEGANRAIIGLYDVLIVNALKKYGVAIEVSPNFSTKRIVLNIQKISGNFNVDADLDNVTIKTLKVNNRPNGVNKLIVYNSDDYSESITFYVHTDRTWDANNTDRIVPVVRELRTATPDSTLDPSEAFLYAAVDVAYDALSGLVWDNLIEIECSPNDPLVNPATMLIGQQVSIYYNGDSYTSILTGKNISYELITLVFGSERIKFTKRRYT